MPERRRRLRALTEECLEDHRGLRSLLESIDQAATRSAAGPEEARRRMAPLLDELAKKLAKHFAWEQESALFTTFPQVFPRFSNALERLGREHGEVLEEVRELIAAAKAGAAPKEGCDLPGRVRVLVATVRRHEAEETEIFQRAYCDDLGSAD